MIGVATAFFAIFSLHILFWRKGRTRFQSVMGCIMAVWAVWCMKDIVTTFPGMYTSEVLNWIMIIDGWSAITYTVLLLETVTPDGLHGSACCCCRCPLPASRWPMPSGHA